MARLLDETGDSYLLEHNPQPGRDGIWPLAGEVHPALSRFQLS